MDHTDPGSVLSPSTTTTSSLHCHDSTESINNNDPDTDSEQHHDPDFIQEFTPDHIPLKHQEQQEEDDQFVTALFARENSSYNFHPPDLSQSYKAWIQNSRLDSIQWVLQSRVRLGFRYRTAYLSIMYFDRFLALQWKILERKLWRMRLLVVTCLSLAAKMEEVKTVKLSAYGSDYKRFCFEAEWIKRMEIRVLNALQWEMRFISPFSFIHFFVRNLIQSSLPVGKAVSRAALIIFQAATANCTMEFKPSVMAMAATLVVMDKTLSKAAVGAKIRRSAVPSYGFSATAEQVYACYEIMKKVVVDDRALLLAAKSPSSSGSSGVSRKRRRHNIPRRKR